MIAEVVSYDSGRWDDGRREHVERQHDVRSIRVEIAEHDGETYPRVGIDSSHEFRSVGLREDGPVAVDLFDDLEHDARGSFVVGSDEAWIKTVVDRELKQTISAIANYHVLGRDVTTEGDVIRLALRSFLEGYVDLRELPEEHRPDGIDELPDFEAIAVNGEESAEGSV